MPRVLAPLAMMAALALLANARPAHAVVLQQKWIAGQQLPYDITLDGTVNVTADEGAPGMLGMMAGNPLEIKLNGTGQTIFDTRSVDEKGVGTLAFLVPRLNIKGNAFGTNAVLDIKDGKASFSLAGKPMGEGARPVPELLDPAIGFLLSPQGRFGGTVALKPAASTDANGKAENGKTPNDKTPNDKAVTRTGPNMGMGGANPIRFLSALSQLWPERDIKTGETWTIQPVIEVFPKPGSAEGLPRQIFLGTITMKLLGQETVANRSAQHIDVRGTLVLDKEKAAILNAANAKANPNAPRLISARQVINGDIWLDAAAGQIVRVVLKVQAQSSATATTPAKNPKEKAQPWNIAQDFDGTLKMNLGKVEQKVIYKRTSASVGF